MGERPERNNSRAPSAAVQKVLLLCGALCLCALVFVFVSIRTQSPPAVPAQTQAQPTPTTTVTPAALPGVRDIVALSRLEELGIPLVEITDAPGNYMLYLSDALDPGLFAFSYLHGYVNGFTLHISIPEKPVVQKNPTAIEQKLLEKYMAASEDLDIALLTTLPPLLQAITPEGGFSSATSLAWVELSKKTRDSGDMQRENAEGYAFTATRANGLLTIAVSAQ